MGKFRVLMDDTNYLAGRQVAGRQFHFIDVTDMDDACGADNAGQPRYVVELCEVDLDAIPSATIESAKKSSGLDDSSQLYRMGSEDWMLAEACQGHGAKALLFTESTNSRTRGIRAASKESYELERNPQKHAEAMNRTVNALGSTAREFMQGDLNSAMVRGVVAGDKKAELMAKMYGAKEEDIKAVQASSLQTAPISRFRLHLQTAPIDRVRLHHPELMADSEGEPLPYCVGFLDGARGAEMAGPREELAEAYLKGYKHGVEVKTGEKPMPDWIRG